VSQRRVHISTASAKPLLIHLRPRASKSLQEQIYEAIRQAVVHGTLAPGSKLFSSRVMVADLGVSRTTTSLALERLAAEGYIFPKVGSGTFVAHDLPFSVPEHHAPAINVPKNPPLSNRGLLLAASPPAATRLGGPMRPFRIGVPALDLSR
jgi:GntR family transcriptional regulator/MocR family aminotransferase